MGVNVGRELYQTPDSATPKDGNQQDYFLYNFRLVTSQYIMYSLMTTHIQADKRICWRQLKLMSKIK